MDRYELAEKLYMALSPAHTPNAKPFVIVLAPNKAWGNTALMRCTITVEPIEDQDDPLLCVTDNGSVRIYPMDGEKDGFETDPDTAEARERAHAVLDVYAVMK